MRRKITFLLTFLVAVLSIALAGVRVYADTGYEVEDYANQDFCYVNPDTGYEAVIVDDAFTIMGVGTVATGNILTGMCREGENACIYKANGDILETRITTVDVHTKERKANGCGYKTEHVGLGLRGISKEQLEKGDKVLVKNANMYGM